MKLRNASALLLTLLVVISSCKKDPKPTNPEQGTANFSRYIAVGNSITSGYSNGGLYLEGQQAAYPNLVAKQMAAVGGGAFTSPFFSTEQANGSGYLRLAGFNGDGTPNIVPVTDKLAVRGTAAIPGFGNVTLYTKYSGAINNYGVPGLKLLYVNYAPYGNLNGYYERLLPGVAGTNSTPYLDFITASPYTFFTFWLGNNDALGYASGGGATDSLTDKSTFAALYNLSITSLTKNGAKGAVGTIPDVTAFAFFNTVTIKALIDGAKKINPLFTTIYIKALNPKTGTYDTRAATDNDLMMLTFNTSSLGATVNGIPGYGLSPLNPLVNRDVLDASEVAMTQDYTLAYNTVIKSVAASAGLAVFDAYTVLNEIKAGKIIDGVPVNAAFITGGVFSLDGVHLTPRGNAITANELIKVVNEKYGSKIPLLNVASYKGVL